MSPRLRILVPLLGLTLARLSAADGRTAFLELLENAHPRAPLAAETAAPLSDEKGFTQIRFSFAADTRQRVPGVLVKATPASSASHRRPVVIALHGTGGTKESQLTLLTDLAREGFIAVAIDGRYHGERSAVGKGSADYSAAILRTFREASRSNPAGTIGATQPAPAREYPFFYDTAWDVMRLIDYLETRDDVDASRIGLIGFSKGGIEAYLAAAADPRIAVVVPCIGVQSFHWALENEAWRSRIETVQSAFDTAAQESGVAKPDAMFVRTFYDRVAPGIYREFDGPAMLPLIAPRALLAINGGTDARTPIPGLEECERSARAAYRAAGSDEKFVLLIQPNTGHKVTDESMKTAHEWLIRWLKP